jgi:hypothetical protein
MFMPAPWMIKNFAMRLSYLKCPLCRLADDSHGEIADPCAICEVLANTSISTGSA